MKLKRLTLLNTGIDMIPVINIAFLLLMFFMLSSVYMNKPAINIDLPDSKISDIQPAWKAVITINKSGLITLNENIISSDRLGIKIKELCNKDDHLNVTIRADKGVPYGKMVEIMDTARLAGVKKISLATFAREE